MSVLGVGILYPPLEPYPPRTIPQEGTWDQTGSDIIQSYNRGFPKIDHSGIDARIVLEQNKFSKKLPLNGIEPLTLGL